MNGEIRKRIKFGFVARNNLEWVNHIHQYCENINNQRHIKNRFTPNELWKPGYHPPPNNLIDFNQVITDHSNIENLRKGHQKKIVQLAQKEIQTGRNKVFRIGDFVRIVITAIDAKYREREKNGMMKKYNAIKYSPDTYRVYNVVDGLGHRRDRTLQQLQGLDYNIWDLKRPQYFLQTTTHPIRTLARHFFGNELIKVPTNEPPHFDWRRVDQLNRLLPYPFPGALR